MRTRKSKVLGDLGSLVEVVIFERTERSDLEGDVVGDDDGSSTLGVLGGD